MGLSRLSLDQHRLGCLLLAMQRFLMSSGHHLGFRVKTSSNGGSGARVTVGSSQLAGAKLNIL